MCTFGLITTLPLTVQAQHEDFTNLRFSTGIFDNSMESAERDTVPLPRKVMFQSMMIPGWGQYTNRQIWKIPIIYGLIGGVTYYMIWSDGQYRAYRAAFYNSFEQNTDFRFGPTPSWIPPDADPELLRANRNFFRNRRDFLIISIVLSYALNVVDAYIFAHMRDFDVSDDLSMRIEPNSDPFLATQSPLNLTFRFRF